MSLRGCIAADEQGGSLPSHPFRLADRQDVPVSNCHSFDSMVRSTLAILPFHWSTSTRFLSLKTKQPPSDVLLHNVNSCMLSKSITASCLTAVERYQESGKAFKRQRQTFIMFVSFSNRRKWRCRGNERTFVFGSWIFPGLPWFYFFSVPSSGKWDFFFFPRSSKYEVPFSSSPDTLYNTCRHDTGFFFSFFSFG